METDEKGKHILSFIESDKGGINAHVKRKSCEAKLCLHTRVWIDEDRRNMQCRDCKSVIECYDWILLLIRKRSWRWESLAYVNEQLKAAGVRLEELRKEERNIKARIRRSK